MITSKFFWDSLLREKNKQRKKDAERTKKRKLALESLEVRELLTVVGFHSVQDAYEGGEAGYFRVERDNTEGELTVRYQLDWRNGNCGNYTGWATNGVDFGYLPGTNSWNDYGSVTFSDGQRYIDIAVTTIDDVWVEPTEQLRLTLVSDGCGCDCDSGCYGCDCCASSSGTPAYTIDSASATGTISIFDNDTATTVWIDSTQNTTEGGDSGYFRLKRDNTGAALTVYYQLDYRNGNCGNYTGWATNGVDFGYLPGTNSWNDYGSVTFAAGCDYVDIVVAPVDDNYVEPTEEVKITLTQSPGCGCGCDCGCGGGGVTYLLDNTKRTATVSIFDNDMATTVWIDSTQDTTEGDDSGYFRLKRDNTGAALTVYYQLDYHNGNCCSYTGWATNGVDFGYLPGTNSWNDYGSVTFAAGCDYVDIVVAPVDDNYVEPTEEIKITLTQSAGCGCGCDCGCGGGGVTYLLDNTKRTATVSIFDNDFPANVWFDSVQDGMEGVRDAYFRLRRDDVTKSIAVRYRIDSSGTTATYGTDYSITAGTSNGSYRYITFAAGQEYADIPLAIVDDDLVENDENVRIELLAAEGVPYQITGNTKVTLKIVDNDGVMLVTAGGPYECESGDTVTLEANMLSDPGGEGNWIYAWDLDGDGVFETNGRFVTFDAEDLPVGAYAVTVRATDFMGNIATDEALVAVIVRRAELCISLPGNGGQPIGPSQSSVFPATERGNFKTLTFRIFNAGNAVLTLDWQNAVFPEGVSVQGPPPSFVAPGSHADVTFLWNAAADLDGTFNISTNDPECLTLQIPFSGTIISVENPPVVATFELLHDSGADGTDRFTFNPKVTGAVSGNFAGGTVLVEFDHNGDGIADGFVTLTSETNGFVYDPAEFDADWPVAADGDIDIVLSYRLIHLDSFGQSFSTSLWNDFTYTLTPAPAFEGTVSDLVAELAVGGSWATPHAVTLRGYAPGAQKVEICVDSTGERILVSSLSYNWFGAGLSSGIPYGETTTIRARGIVYDPVSKMELYGDWSVLTVSPMPPDIVSLTLKHDTGSNSVDGISGDLTLTGRIDSYVPDDYGNGCGYTYQRNSFVEIEFRCGEALLGHAFTDDKGEFIFNPRNLPVVDGIPQGSVTARAIYRNSDGDPVFGNASSKWIRYEAAVPPSATGFSLVDPKPGNVSNNGKVKAGVRVPVGSDARLEYSYRIGSEWSEGAIIVPFNPDELAANATHETRTAEYRVPGLNSSTPNTTIGVRVRALVYDSMLDDYVAGNWITMSFNFVKEINNPASIRHASIKNWTGGAYISTADPTVSGRISNDGDLEGLTVEAWSGGKVVGTALTDAQGDFTIRPSGMNYGQTLLQIKVREWNPITEAWQYGATMNISFEFLVRTVSRPEIENLLLSDVTGAFGTTSNPRFEGRIAVDGENLNRILIEIDLDDDHIADTYIFTDSNGNFGYTPDLESGPQTIHVRACRFDTVAGDWVPGDWSALNFTMTTAPEGWIPEIIAVGPAFVKSTESTVTTDDPALSGKVSSQGGFHGITVQIDLGSDSVVDHEMTADAAGTFRWRPLIDTSVESTVSGRVRAGRLDETTNRIIWGDWISFEYDYIPSTREHEPVPSETEQTTKLRLVYTKEETSGIVNATGIRITGANHAGQAVSFDVNGDGTADFSLTTDSSGFISFDAFPKVDSETFGDGLLFGNAWIASSGMESSKVRFAVINLREDSDLDETDLLHQQREFYAGYTTLLEAYDELEQLLDQTSPVKTPTDVGETMTDEQYAAAQAQALARLGLTASDLAGISGVTAPSFPDPISIPLPELENNAEYRSAIEQINNAYRTAIADLNRNFALQQIEAEQAYEQQQNEAWGEYHFATHNVQQFQSFTPQPADSLDTPELQAGWAHQTIDASHAFETQSLQAMADLVQHSISQQAAYQCSINVIYAQTVAQTVHVTTAAAENSGNPYLSQFVANAIAEMLANNAAGNAYNEAVNSANRQAAQASLEAWKTASQQVLDAEKAARKAKIDAWKSIRKGAIQAEKSYNNAVKSANENYVNEKKSLQDEYDGTVRQSLDEYRRTYSEALEIYENEQEEAGYPYYYADYEKIAKARRDFDKKTEDARMKHEKTVLTSKKTFESGRIDLYKEFVDKLADVDYDYEDRCIDLLESYWKAIHGAEIGLQESCLAASSGYASSLNGVESGLSAALLGASTAYATATTTAAQTRANADLNVENAMLGDEGSRYFADYFAACADLTGAVAAYYSALGGIDQGLFETSLGASTALVSALLGKSFGAELASIDVSDAYGSAVNDAASGYADSMLEISEEYAGAGIDIADNYTKDIIDAKIAYMKSANAAERTLRKAGASATKRHDTDTLNFVYGLAEDYHAALDDESNFDGCQYRLDYGIWYHGEDTSCSSHSHDCYRETAYDSNFGVSFHIYDPGCVNIEPEYQASTAKAELSYKKAMAEASKSYTGKTITAGRAATEASYDAAEAAAEGEQDAAETYCEAVQAAAEAANVALIAIAENSDTTQEIISYLTSMLAAELGAESARMAAVGAYQIAVKQDYLDGLGSTTDHRYQAALEDLQWTQAVVGARNSYYSESGAATLRYHTAVYSARQTYAATSRQLRNSFQSSQRQISDTYSATQRQNVRTYTTTKFRADRDLEFALLDATFSRWESEANYEAEAAGSLLAEYQAGLDAIGGVDAADAVGMYGNLSLSLSSWQSAGASAFGSFCNDQFVVQEQAVASAHAAAALAHRTADSVHATAVGAARAAYESQYYGDYAAYLLADGAAYADYVSVIDVAQQEFEKEQCRLTGLLQDAVNTGVNNVASGTTSLDVQVCFVAGTPILMGDESSKAIEKVEKDDIVLARPHDDPTGPLRKCRVVRKFVNEPQSTWKLSFDNGIVIQATKEHPFYVSDKEWTAADDLQIGVNCTNVNGEPVRLVFKEWIEEKQPVYNFEVEECHTYFVGKTKEKSILVHNECSQCGGELCSCPNLSGKWLVTIHSTAISRFNMYDNGHAWVTYHQLDENNQFTGKAYVTGTGKPHWKGAERPEFHFSDTYIHEFTRMTPENYKAGKIVSQSAIVENPPVEREKDGSYKFLFNNCSDHAVHVWELSTGQCLYAHGYVNQMLSGFPGGGFVPTTGITPALLTERIVINRFLGIGTHVDFTLPGWLPPPGPAPAPSAEGQ